MYIGNIKVLNMGDGATPPSVNVELWRVWTTISSGGVGTDHSSLMGSATISTGGGNNVPFSIGDAALSPVASTSSDHIAVSVRAPGDNGYLFRSPIVQTLPNPGAAADVLDIWRGGETMLTSLSLPAVPMVVDQTTTVTAISATLKEGAIDLRADGTTTIGPATPISSPATNTFTYTLSFTIEPAGIHAPDVALIARATDDGNLVFGGFGLGNSFFSVLLNLMAPFMKENILNSVIEQINADMARSVAASAVTTLGGQNATLPPGGGLPAGVRTSVENVVIHPDAITLFPTLTAFGSLNAVFFPNAGGGGGGGGGWSCAITTLAALGAQLSTPMLHHFRDNVLRNNPAGRKLVDIYYQHSPELSQVFAQDAELSRVAKEFLTEATAALRANAGIESLQTLAMSHYHQSRTKLPSSLCQDMDAWLAQHS